MRAAHGDPQLNRRQRVGTELALACLRSIHAPPSKKCGHTEGQTWQPSQSRASVLWILLARPPQPFGAENSYEKVQNVVTDCTAFQVNANSLRNRLVLGTQPIVWQTYGKNQCRSGESTRTPTHTNIMNAIHFANVPHFCRDGLATVPNHYPLVRFEPRILVKQEPNTNRGAFIHDPRVEYLTGRDLDDRSCRCRSAQAAIFFAHLFAAATFHVFSFRQPFLSYLKVVQICVNYIASNAF